MLHLSLTGCIQPLNIFLSLFYAFLRFHGCYCRIRLLRNFLFDFDKYIILLSDPIVHLWPHQGWLVGKLLFRLFYSLFRDLLQERVLFVFRHIYPLFFWNVCGLLFRFLFVLFKQVADGFFNKVGYRQFSINAEVFQLFQNATTNSGCEHLFLSHENPISEKAMIAKEKA